MLSIIVNFYNNRREAMNTLHSLTRGYQRAAQNISYEVIAIDNGSQQPLSEGDVRAFGPEFSYRYVQTRSPSPGEAINAACHDAAGEHLMVIIDGAHIISPGMLRLATAVFAIFPGAFVATPGFHLGPKTQNYSVLEGYNQQVEDALLGKIAWKENGYRLYNAAGGFADVATGWFGYFCESGCFALRKDDYLSIGGFDKRFRSRGGGMTSLDFFQRAVTRQELEYVVLLGEGTFHQFHGGVASNVPMDQHPLQGFHEEYVRIRGKSFQHVFRRPFYLGTVPDEALHIARISADKGLQRWQRDAPPGG